MRLSTAYRRDLDRATAMLLEHVQSGAYDGVALILKPISHAYKPALVVGGFYRHRLTEATDATMQLHLAIKLRAREQGLAPQPRDGSAGPRHPPNHQEEDLDQGMQPTLQEKWNAATARYHRCEKMLRILFSDQLRASPETTAILLSITQLHIETVANCLWELVRRPGRATPQAQLETLNAIQQFRTVRDQVSAWMPPAGEEDAYFLANSMALTAALLCEGDSLLAEVEGTLERLLCRLPLEPIGTHSRPRA